MTVIAERERIEIRKILSAMKNPVNLINFTQTFECDTCHDTRALLEELAGISDKLSLEVLNFTLDKEKAAAYGIDKIPATVIEGERDYGIRFYGVPGGYEFASLLDAIVLASQGDSGLEPESRAVLASVHEPLHLEVLVTPT
jgi:alkyl hydroperoxide reductase subunit AhpF